MTGGNHSGARSSCARRLATGLLSGLLVAPWSVAAIDAQAEDEAQRSALTIVESSDDAAAADAASDAAEPAESASTDNAEPTSTAAAPATSEASAAPNKDASSDEGASTADAPATTEQAAAATGESKPAAEAVTARDCATGPQEQSIIVENSPAASSDVVAVTDPTPSNALEPIANVSDYEPELAEPTPADEPAMEPTLADDAAVVAGQTIATDATADHPSADDVCVEEPVTAEIIATSNLEPATFNGITPGVSTRQDVTSHWGAATSADDKTGALTFESEGAPVLTVTFLGDKVESLRVALTEPAAVEQLVERLGLKGIRPLTVADENGAALSTAFPERGVTLEHMNASVVTAGDVETTAKDADLNRVNQIVIGPITAGPFIDRSLRCAALDYASQRTDLELALEVDGASAEVRYRLSQIRLATSQPAIAEELARTAVELQPRNDAYRLQWAKCLKYLARYDRAVDEIRIVLEGATATPLVRAQAVEQMGLLAALGSRDVQERSLPLHNQAIELATALLESQDDNVRLAAGQLMVNSHLAVAERLAHGDWQQKDEAVAQWIGRASSLSEEMIANGEADVTLRLQVALSALTAGGRLAPPIDPELWVAEAEQAVRDSQAIVADQRARDELNWQLGLVYLHACEIQHRRGKAESAIKYGETADSMLAPLCEMRQELPDTEYALGQVYFQVGAVYAVHLKDHDMACQWYDRAVDLLLKPVPVTTLAAPGHHGDALVSMGVSYWEVGQRDRAYELTKAGVELVGQGIEEGLLVDEALAVPKSNLAAMDRAMGRIKAAIPAQTRESANTQVAEAPRPAAKQSASPRPATKQVRTTDRRGSSAGDTTRR